MRTIEPREVVGYFWVLILLVFVGFMWWKVSGILNRSDLCILQSGFKCQEKELFMSNGTPTIKILVKNNLGRWVEITGFMCSSETPDPSIGHPDRDFEATSINVFPDAEFEISGSCYLNSDKKDDTFKGIVYLRYELKDDSMATVPNVVVGNIRGEFKQ